MSERQHHRGTGSAELDRLPVGVLRLDGHGTITEANRVAGELVGFPPRQLVGRNILEFSAEGDGDERAPELLSFSAEHREPMGPVPVRYRHRDGSIRLGDLWAENHLHDPAVAALCGDRRLRGGDAVRRGLRHHDDAAGRHRRPARTGPRRAVDAGHVVEQPPPDGSGDDRRRRRSTTG